MAAVARLELYLAELKGGQRETSPQEIQLALSEAVDLLDRMHSSDAASSHEVELFNHQLQAKAAEYASLKAQIEERRVAVQILEKKLAARILMEKIGQKVTRFQSSQRCSAFN
eukprot:GILK01015319.1.p2 GENE.GILK01015319.1~~GILK01015319.1.p2  ORF type:complete len:125 (-),score=24.82 GILK01015319.1:350-688(-)